MVDGTESIAQLTERKTVAFGRHRRVERLRNENKTKQDKPRQNKTDDAVYRKTRRPSAQASIVMHAPRLSLPTLARARLVSLLSPHLPHLPYKVKRQVQLDHQRPYDRKNNAKQNKNRAIRAKKNRGRRWLKTPTTTHNLYPIHYTVLLRVERQRPSGMNITVPDKPVTLEITHHTPLGGRFSPNMP